LSATAYEQLEVLAVLHAAATGDDDAGGGQLRTVGLGQLFADEGGNAGILSQSPTASTAAAAFGGLAASKPVVRTVITLIGIGRLHGGDRVAGVDRTLEGVGADHGSDLGDLGNIEQRGGARQDVLAVAGGGCQNVAVALAEFGDQQAHVLGKLVGIGGVVGQQHLADAGDLARPPRPPRQPLPATSTWTSPPICLAAVTVLSVAPFRVAVVVLGNDQNTHQITFASFLSLSTSSATNFRP
jgi:hypothetical protein